LTRYVKSGCVSIELRDEIMTHAEELIRQIIRTHNFGEIYGHDSASFGDLFQTAWAQIESVLYKFDYSPGHKRVFNMWSQVAKSVILAYIKKETRDRKNYAPYRNHYVARQNRATDLRFRRFLDEVREICQFSDTHMEIVNALEELYLEDERPHDGLVSKLIKRSGMSRSRVSGFFKYIKLRSFEFSDSPFNQEMKAMEPRRKKYSNNLNDDD